MRSWLVLAVAVLFAIQPARAQSSDQRSPEVATRAEYTPTFAASGWNFTPAGSN